MHDPDVVAFEIRRPWPHRERARETKSDQRRWSFRLHHECGDCTEEERAQHGPNPFPWWRPKSWTPFWTVAGKGWYWPPMITVWHREPDGRDSGEVCKHYTRHQDAAGKWQTKIRHGWKLHLHHWRLQLHPLQALRRWALTRCAWCNGRHRSSDPINVSSQWDAPRGRWWKGEAGLCHLDCSAIQRAHRTCTCPDPLLAHDGWGTCVLCGKGRSYGQAELRTEQARLLAAVPAGQRDRAAYQRICDMYAESEAKETA